MISRNNLQLSRNGQRVAGGSKRSVRHGCADELWRLELAPANSVLVRSTTYVLNSSFDCALCEFFCVRAIEAISFYKRQEQLTLPVNKFVYCAICILLLQLPPSSVKDTRTQVSVAKNGCSSLVLVVFAIAPLKCQLCCGFLFQKAAKAIISVVS